MLRNIFYDKKKSIIHHWLYANDGEPIYRKVQYKPYLYIPTKDNRLVISHGIDGTPLAKKEFSSEWERTEYLKTYKGTKYFNLPATQQYLLENYYDSDIIDLTRQPLRIFYYDIEVISEEFPDPKDAKFPLTSITVFDSKTKKYYVWGVKPYNHYSCKDHLENIEPEEIVYNFTPTEKELLQKFLRFWRANFPDLIVGYNSYSFDMPYIVRRIESVLGEGKSKNLSPVEYIYGQEKENKFKQTYTEYTIGGVSHLDYMILYKTFTPGERESDGLDFVAKEELGMGKLDYGELSLHDLCHTDWNRFINYNIWDVKLLILIDERRKYLEIAKFSAFSGFCNIDKALGKVAIITGIIAKQGLLKNKIITTQDEGVKERIPGGYVKQPENTMHTDIVSFDANSLYPSTIITLNISPEMKVAKIVKEENDQVVLFFFKKGVVTSIPKDKLQQFLVRNDCSISAAGIVFHQKEKGLAASFCDELYEKRKNIRKEVEIMEKKLEKLNPESNEYISLRKTADQKDTEQYLYKILLNSTYGVFCNRFFALFDPDCARSITLTGQEMIRKTDQTINDFVSKEWDLEWKDIVVAGDTDSCLITIKDIKDKYKFELIDENGDLTPEFVEVENKISDHINSTIRQWAIDKWNSKDPRFFFKRESVCPRAIWTGKKHYILHLVNKEGKKMNKFKYSGLSLAKSTWSIPVRNLAKKIVETAIMISKDNKQANDMINEIFNTDFQQLSPNDIAQRTSIKVLNKWEGKNNKFDTATGTHGTAKLCIYHNELLKTLNLTDKYPKIVNGSKVKIVFLKENKFNLPAIAYQNELPPEFNLTIDYTRHFFKGFLQSLTPIYEALRWNLPDPRKQVEFSLEDLFG